MREQKKNVVLKNKYFWVVNRCARRRRPWWAALAESSSALSVRQRCWETLLLLARIEGRRLSLFQVLLVVGIRRRSWWIPALVVPQGRPGL